MVNDIDITTYTLYNRLYKMESERGSAKHKGLEYCTKCGVCCHRATGMLQQKDLKPIADFLKITPEQLFKKFLVARKCIFDIWHVAPRKKGQKAGIESYSIAVDKPCIFLTQKGCRIHAVKPTECRSQQCWKENDLPDKEKHLIRYGWKLKDLKELGFIKREDFDCYEG